MQKREIILQKFARGEDERLLLARAYDRAAAAEKGGRAAATHFLDPAERLLLERALSGERGVALAFYGGYDGAERTLAVFSPESAYASENAGQSALAAVRITPRGENGLSHRDYLGALLGLGIKRETVGDLLVRPDGCDAVALCEVCRYIADSLEAVGRAKADAAVIPLSGLLLPEEKFTLLRATVATLRLDAVIGEGFSLSRAEAADLVRSGAARLDHMPCEKPDAGVSEGALISLRGHGRVRLFAVGGKTRKDRTAIIIKKYL